MQIEARKSALSLSSWVGMLSFLHTLVDALQNFTIFQNLLKRSDTQLTTNPSLIIHLVSETLNARYVYICNAYHLVPKEAKFVSSNPVSVRIVLRREAKGRHSFLAA